MSSKCLLPKLTILLLFDWGNMSETSLCLDLSLSFGCLAVSDILRTNLYSVKKVGI